MGKKKVKVREVKVPTLAKSGTVELPVGTSVYEAGAQALQSAEPGARFVLIIENEKEQTYVVYRHLGLSYGAVINALLTQIVLLCADAHVPVEHVLESLALGYKQYLDRCRFRDDPANKN